MKCIEKALAEESGKIKRGWWGTSLNGYRVLMRYGHVMVIWKDRKVFWTPPQNLLTKTDIIGIRDAIKQIEKNETQSAKKGNSQKD